MVHWELFCCSLTWLSWKSTRWKNCDMMCRNRPLFVHYCWFVRRLARKCLNVWHVLGGIRGRQSCTDLPLWSVHSGGSVIIWVFPRAEFMADHDRATRMRRLGHALFVPLSVGQSHVMVGLKLAKFLIQTLIHSVEAINCQSEQLPLVPVENPSKIEQFPVGRPYEPQVVFRPCAKSNDTYVEDYLLWT